MSSTISPAPTTTRTTTVVPYRHICPTCGRAFQRATGLERHRRSAHSKEKSYACEFCSQAYSRIDLLQRHVSLYHKRAAADKGRMQESIEMEMAQQPVMSQQHQSLQNGVPHTSMPHYQSNHGYDSMITPPPGMQHQPSHLVNYHMDQDLLNWFNGTALGPSEMLDDSVMQDTASAFSSSTSLPWAASNFSEPLHFYSSNGGGSSGTSAGVVTPVTVSSGMEHFPSFSLNDTSNDTPFAYLTPPHSMSVSAASMDLPTIQGLDIWPLPQPSHLEAYRHHFAYHMPFIHTQSLLYLNKTIDELECDVQRAMTIVGANYESLSKGFQLGSNDSHPPLSMKPCDYYGCSSLKAKIVRSIESMPEQPLGGNNSVVQILLRRTQIMTLLQIVAMFSEVKTHRVSAKLTHGALVALAHELLQHVSFGDHDGSWAQWIQHEEIVRTLWSVYLVDSLQSFCYQRPPGLSLSELSDLPDLGPDDLWLATSEAEFKERAVRFTTDRESIFDIVLSLKDAAPPAPPGCLSLSGQLLVVINLVTEIMSTVQADTATRRQLATRLDRISSIPEGDRANALRLLRQAVDRGDAHLRQQIELHGCHLTRWLSLLDHSSSRRNLQNKGPTPFICDFMPWYWAGMHLLGVLRGRLAPGCSGPDQLHERLMSHVPKSHGHAGGTNDGSLEVMYLLVRIRLSLNVLDGGAKMQSAIGSMHFTAALPALPDYLATISVAGLFPPVR